jgi:hypothetical protein
MVAALAAALVLVGAAVAAQTVGIYRNAMSTPGQRGQLSRVLGDDCKRGGSPRALRVQVGKRTDECAYRTQVVGRDLEILATERLLSGTPKRIRNRVFLGLTLRVGGGGGYQLRVFPLQRKYQLVKTTQTGERSFLAIGKQVRRIRGANKANKLRLRAFNMIHTRDPDDARLLVYIGDKRFVNVVDDSAGPLRGRMTAVSVGTPRGFANGAAASFDDVIVRVPNPY